MTKPYIELSYFQVALAALLILINGAVSVLLKLELERRLLLAAACTIVQLLLIGLVLEWVFRTCRRLARRRSHHGSNPFPRSKRESSRPRHSLPGPGAYVP